MSRFCMLWNPCFTEQMGYFPKSQVKVYFLTRGQENCPTGWRNRPDTTCILKYIFSSILKHCFMGSVCGFLHKTMLLSHLILNKKCPIMELGQMCKSGCINLCQNHTNYEQPAQNQICKHLFYYSFIFWHLHLWHVSQNSFFIIFFFIYVYRDFFFHIWCFKVTFK